MSTEPIDATGSAVAMASAIKFDSELFEAWAQGGVELYQQIGEYATVSATLADAVYALSDNISFVWEYDVDEEFGALFEKEIRRDKNNNSSQFGQMKEQLGRIAMEAIATNSGPEVAMRAAVIVSAMTGYVGGEVIQPLALCSKIE